ncbi:hypothetical protein Riv7116_0820 [Rivularia sp. PCC 7116]|uniref:hypothetical protein n=1 Tax=Rivularia sp. PCC 7116 TaxID=373994 RepID=UPI00029EC53D|nr:hypothetical protein [Rivularia sp. PCC 7116]AFY53405.1 hypothetical protein Riv7116_0820 [Rivularia sp. PCC 7116]
MIEINKCQNCAANLEHRIKGSTQGLFCERCDKWVIVTTYIPAIRQDETKYKIYLLLADSQNKQHIKALAKAANINFLEARKMIEEDKSLILEDKAVEIDRVREILHDLSIKYDIEPLFPY